MTVTHLKDVSVATILPFDEDYAIDWASFENVLAYCAYQQGVDSVFVNGHAGEVATLSPQERIDVIRFAKQRLRPGVPLLAGIVAYSTSEAVARAREAQEAGADVAVLFVFPQYAGGAGADPRAAFAYVDAIAAAIDLPLSIFQTPVAGGAGYTTENLLRLARHPRVIAIKEGTGDIEKYEDNWRLIKAETPDVAILASNYDWLLAQAAVGADGILSGMGSLLPDALCELWAATKSGNLSVMRAVNDTLHPIVRTIYGARPLMDMHTRLKVGLKHLGVIRHALPRQPLLPVTEDIAAKVRATVDAAGLAERVARTDVTPFR